MSGQVRMRVRYRRQIGRWFDYLLVSPDEMRALAVGTGWSVSRIFRSAGSPLYVAVMRKDRDRWYSNEASAPRRV